MNGKILSTYKEKKQTGIRKARSDWNYIWRNTNTLSALKKKNLVLDVTILVQRIWYVQIRIIRMCHIQYYVDF